MSASNWRLRIAQEADFGTVAQMLAEADLPGEGMEEQFGNSFVVAEQAGNIVGAVAGGHEVWFGVPIRAGDEITYENKIIDIYEKQGRSGPMIFIIDEWIYRNQRGEEVCRSRETLIRTK